VWEAVYIIEGLLKNASEIQPTTIHADTQGQSLPVFTMAHLMGFDLMPRIRQWQDLIFWRPSPAVRYEHIDALFGTPGRNVIDWDLIETHFKDLMQIAISIREGSISSSVLLRRLRSGSRRNATYAAFREVGQVIRTVQLLRFLSDGALRRRVTAATNKVEAFNNFCQWLFFGKHGVIADNDPDEQEKTMKFNALLSNCVIFHTTLELTEPFSSSVCLAYLQYVDGLGELAGAPGAAAELAENAPGLELGVRTLAGRPQSRVRAVGLFLRFRLVLPPVRDLRVHASLVALIGQDDQARGLEPGQHAPDPLGLLVMHRAGQRPGHPQDVPAGTGDDLQVHPVLAVLAGVERPVRGHPVDGDQRAVQDDVGVPGLLGVPDRLAELGRPGGQQRDGLVHVPPGRGGPDPEPRRDLGERLALAQVDQDQQGLPAGVQRPPGRPDGGAVAADDPGHEGEGLARQRQRGTVEKHGSPWWW